MKLKLGVLLLSLSLAFACGHKKGDEHEHGHDGEHHHEPAAKKQKESKEMDEFHMVMAEAFHPYKDSSNLAPAKANAEDLLVAAKAWEAAELPDNESKDKIKSLLQYQTTLAEKFREDVKSGNDETIGKSLTVMHDVFHEIQSLWYGAAGGDHGDHHDDHHNH
jgi:hypothetical protein